MKAVVIGSRYYAGITKKGNDLDGYFIGFAYDQRSVDGKAVDTKYFPKSVLGNIVPRPNMCLDLSFDMNGMLISVADCTEK